MRVLPVIVGIAPAFWTAAVLARDSPPSDIEPNDHYYEAVDLGTFETGIITVPDGSLGTGEESDHDTIDYYFFDVPAGSWQIEVGFGPTPLRLAAAGVSLVSVVGLAGVVYWMVRRSRATGPDEL